MIEPKHFGTEFNVQKVNHEWAGAHISVWVRSPVCGYEFNTTRMDNQVCFTRSVKYTGDSIDYAYESELIRWMESVILREMQADTSPNFAVTRSP